MQHQKVTVIVTQFLFQSNFPIPVAKISCHTPFNLLLEKHVSELEMVEKVKVCARPKGGNGGDRVGDELEGDLVRVGRREAGLGAEPAAEHLSADGQQAGDEAVRLEEGADPGAGATEGRRPLDHTPLLKLQASGRTCSKQNISMETFNFD